MRSSYKSMLTYGCVVGLASLGCRSPAERRTEQASTGAAPRAAGVEALSLALGGGEAMELVRVPAGAFLMGSPEGEVGRLVCEGPQHEVTLGRPFYIGRYEVTQAQWYAVMGENPSWHKGDRIPVCKVTWTDCREFCRRVSAQCGRAVRLPTEAEWEYACRAGTDTPHCFGASGALSEFAWYAVNAGGQPHAVGGKRPNAWGLYDVHGNVWEWCQDAFLANYVGVPDDGRAPDVADPDPTGELGNPNPPTRVLRGGSWFNPADMCRSAYRLRRWPFMRSAYIGFRVVVEAESGRQ